MKPKSGIPTKIPQWSHPTLNNCKASLPPHHLWDPLGIQSWVFFFPFPFSFFFFFSLFFLMLVLASYIQNFITFFTITKLLLFKFTIVLNSFFYLSYNLSHYFDVKFSFKFLCAYKLFMFLLLLLL